MDWKTHLWGGVPKAAQKTILRQYGELTSRTINYCISNRYLRHFPALRNRFAPCLSGLTEGTAQSAEVIGVKQAVASITLPGYFVKAARRPKGKRKLRAEFAGWKRFQEEGLSHLVTPRLQLLERPGGWLLLINLKLQHQPQERFLASMAELLPPLVRKARGKGRGLPATVRAGYEIVQEHAPSDMKQQLPSLKDLKRGFSAPYPLGLFHRDLHNGNVLLLEGRPLLSDLKSCLPNRVVDLDLIRVMAYHYPGTSRGSRALKAFEAARQGWSAPEVEAIAQLVTLPRELWAGAYFFHKLGRSLAPERGRSLLRQRLRASIRRRFIQQILQDGLRSPAVGL